MSSLEFSAKNVDKAIEKACEELDLATDKIRYDILSHGSSGIFGLAGFKKAKIRVYLPEAPQNDQNDGLHAEVSKTPDEIPHATILSSGGLDQDNKPERLQTTEFNDNLLDIGRSALQRIVDSMTDDAEISAEEISGKLVYNVNGGNAGIIIGKKGQTLDAIQLLVEKIVNKHHSHKAKIRIQIDVEGYLETRKANLEKLAERLANKSKRIRKPISLGQMSAYDRRIVHLALKDDPDIRTKSRGEGYMRKLVIFPQKNSKQRQHLRSQ
ncbi:MAG: RNA-binding cell elongation regulator Jag/EloR [Desulfobacterales bacterium]|jgi:spoIIIJ-associated protein